MLASNSITYISTIILFRNLPQRLSFFNPSSHVIWSYKNKLINTINNEGVLLLTSVMAKTQLDNMWECPRAFIVAAVAVGFRQCCCCAHCLNICMDSKSVVNISVKWFNNGIRNHVLATITIFDPANLFP